MTKREERFIEACERNDIDYISSNVTSLKNKLFVDSEGQSPMLICMMNDSFDAADILIENGFNINSDGNIAPIAGAIKENSTKAIDYLIKNGVDLNLPFDNTTKTMPIAFSIHKGFKEITNILINNGADLSITQRIHISDIEDTIDEWPMISIAAQSGNLDLFEKVVKNSDVNLKSKLGLLPFYCLMAVSSDPKHTFQTKAAKILINEGAKLEPNAEDENRGISSSAITLMFSTEMSEKDRVLRERLILEIFERGLADPFYIDIEGNNMIKRAAAMGSLKIVKKLINLGVDVSKPNKDGATSLHDAALIPDRDISYKIINELLKYPHNLDARSSDGSIAVECAFNRVNYDSANRMIEIGARIPENAFIKQNDQTMPLWVQLVSHLRRQDDVERLINLIKKGLKIKNINYKSYSSKKSQLNILGVVLSRVILQSNLKINKQWGGFLDEDNMLHDILDYEELINLLLIKHQEEPFPDIKIKKNTYKIKDMLEVLQNENLLSLKVQI